MNQPRSAKVPLFLTPEHPALSWPSAIAHDTAAIGISSDRPVSPPQRESTPSRRAAGAKPPSQSAFLLRRLPERSAASGSARPTPEIYCSRSPARRTRWPPRRYASSG
jgi:hypothetical protein